MIRCSSGALWPFECTEGSGDMKVAGSTGAGDWENVLNRQIQRVSTLLASQSGGQLSTRTFTP